MSDIDNNDAIGSDQTRDSRKRPRSREESDSESSTGQNSEKYVYLDPRVGQLMQQVAALTDALIGNRVEIAENSGRYTTRRIGVHRTAPQPSRPKERFRVRGLSTVVKESPTPKADARRVDVISALQHFNSEEWSGVRYMETQKLYTATPAFVELEVNEELKRLDKKTPSHQPWTVPWGRSLMPS